MLILVIYLFTTNSKSQYRIQYGVRNIVIYCEQNSVLKCILNRTVYDTVYRTVYGTKYNTVSKMVYCTLYNSVQCTVQCKAKLQKLTFNSPIDIQFPCQGSHWHVLQQTVQGCGLSVASKIKPTSIYPRSYTTLCTTSHTVNSTQNTPNRKHCELNIVSAILNPRQMTKC